MPPRKPAKAVDQKQALASVTADLAALDSLSTAELAARYFALEGVPTRSRNRQYLHKQVSYLVQAKAFGGLQDAAKQRIATLGDALPIHWRERVAPAGKPAKQGKAVQAAPAPSLAPSRDARLPPVGSTFSRQIGRTTHTVKVLADGLEYQGARYASVSEIARKITGTQRNGYRFFKLTSPR